MAGLGEVSRPDANRPGIEELTKLKEDVCSSAFILADIGGDVNEKFSEILSFFQIQR
jgi:hypothetical protein